MVEGKLAKHEEQKGLQECCSPLLFSDALRLPNISLKGATDNMAAYGKSDGYASPTQVL